ncbi:UbiD family decarboxylase [Alkaliphilus peptidifermentans]|uniref:2,5-furandicarboxylate decarboxylase 1 n=1 Tax=Alkaliphilus peptidifermentans DSM 18978 TaxID=1120976 RepID=A0A1G5KXJ9_9FIRM|nr:UbiD family decarboxylase [Alkaliphilus peptidifermentans]SCZ04649.1 2,5-furandicarboxylate decarboxylase 1 [Alkaliphilus peptidifermentans DSM 18978]
METQMLRAAMDQLRRKGYLQECNKEVDPKFELGAVLKYYKNEVPILFNKVKGSKVPVVGALFGERDIYYEMLGITHEERIFRIIDAIANPKPTKLLSKGPIMENIITRNIDLQRMFPIPTFHEEDSSSYITAGLVVLKDPETGKSHVSVRRLQINKGNEISILVASPLATKQFSEMEKQNKPLEVAIVLGYDYSLLLASQISSETYGVDKYEVDSALRGEPIELVKCHSIDVEVPAFSEIVLEGIMPPNKREIEGPFGELMGYYGAVGPHPIVEVKTVMHRNNPIFQTAFPCREEHLSNGLIREVELYTSVKSLVDVKDVNVTVAGGCRFHAFVSINKRSDGDGKSAILGALASSKDVKHVVIVDNDVDIYDPSDIEWAIATRMQASQDLVIIPGALGSGLEPSHTLRGVTDKVGIDATRPLGDAARRFERAIIPGYEDIDIKKYLPGFKLK